MSGLPVELDPIVRPNDRGPGRRGRRPGARDPWPTSGASAANLEAIGQAGSVLERTGLEVGALRSRRLAEGPDSAAAMSRHGGAKELYGALAAVLAKDRVTLSTVDQGE